MWFDHEDLDFIGPDSAKSESAKSMGHTLFIK